MNIELKIGVGNADVGALALFFAEIIDDGVFCLVGDKFRMPKLLRINDSIYRKSSLQIKIFVPGDGLHSFIDLISVFSLKVFKRLEHPYGRA